MIAQLHTLPRAMWGRMGRVAQVHLPRSSSQPLELLLDCVPVVFFLHFTTAKLRSRASRVLMERGWRKFGHAIAARSELRAHLELASDIGCMMSSLDVWVDHAMHCFSGRLTLGSPRAPPSSVTAHSSLSLQHSKLRTSSCASRSKLPNWDSSERGAPGGALCSPARADI